MSVRKKAEGNDTFEDVVKQPDRVEQFTIASIDRQIASIDGQIIQLQERKTVLLTRKSAAQAL